MQNSVYIYHPSSAVQVIVDEHELSDFMLIYRHHKLQYQALLVNADLSI